MKQEFSTAWEGSKQVRKQRKYRHNAPLHRKDNFLSANLSKELRMKYGKRNVPIRKGDEVLIMRGKFRKKKGKILIVDKKRTRVTVEGIDRSKVDGTKVSVYFDPSALQIEALNLDDKKRLKRNTVVRAESGSKPKEDKKVETKSKSETSTETNKSKQKESKDNASEKK